MSPTAEKIWSLADQYVEYAVPHLGPQGPHHDDSSTTSFDGIVERLRVKFLFPFASPDGIDLLLQGRLRRWMLVLSKKSDATNPTAESALAGEHLEASFEEVAVKLRTMLHGPSLSEVQKEILERHFLKVSA